MSANGDTTAMPSSQAEEILQLLREQATLYAKLDAYSARQRGLVTGDDVRPLLEVLAERQKLSEQLGRVAARLAPVRSDWSLHRAAFSPGQRDEADRLLREQGCRLREIMQRDEQDARVLAGRKEAVARALRAGQVTQQAVGAYGARARVEERSLNDGSQFDLRSADPDLLTLNRGLDERA